MNIMPSTIPKDFDKYFFNRKQDIAKINAYLSMLEKDIPNQFLITGYRGVGKTFLLRKILKDQDKKFLTAYIDLSNIFAREISNLTEEEVMKELLLTIKKSISKDKTIYEQIKNNIAIFLKQLKIKDYDFNSNADIFDIPLPIIKNNYNKLSKFVMELPQKIVDSSDEIKGFIIVIDEFQLLGTIKSPEAFFWLIRSYSQQQFNVSYIFTGSVSKTSEVTEMLNGQTGAFGGRMIQIDIEPFSREETKRYVDEKSNNVKFSDKGFNQFYLCTKGIPIYINTLCSILPANSVCDENIILENIKLNIDHIALMWIYVWGRLNANEREIVILLNENNGANWTTLKNSLPYSTPTISKYLDSLSNKGIVDYDFNKKYVISDNMLKTWLSIKKEQNGRYPL